MTKLTEMLDRLERLERAAPDTLGNVANRSDLQPSVALYNESKRAAPALVQMLREAVGALEHISHRDGACSPCNGRADYDVREHDEEIARKALKRLDALAAKEGTE